MSNAMPPRRKKRHPARRARIITGVGAVYATAAMVGVMVIEGHAAAEQTLATAAPATAAPATAAPATAAPATAAPATSDATPASQATSAPVATVSAPVAVSGGS